MLLYCGYAWISIEITPLIAFGRYVPQVSLILGSTSFPLIFPCHWLIEKEKKVNFLQNNILPFVLLLELTCSSIFHNFCELEVLLEGWIRFRFNFFGWNTLQVMLSASYYITPGDTQCLVVPFLVMLRLTSGFMWYQPYHPPF